MSQKVARILKLRDDYDIIRHSLVYYYNLGVDEQFIMLHMPTEQTFDIISDVQTEIPDIKLNIYKHDIDGIGLNAINNDYLTFLTNKALGKNFKWIIGSDADEFIILQDCERIQDFVLRYDNLDYVSLLFKWVNYYITKNEVQWKFYDTMSTRRSGFMPWTKCTGKFNNSMTFVQGLHHIVGGGFKEIEVDYNIAYYAHFPYRNKEQFVTKNKIQAEKFKDWRLNVLKNDPLYFEKYFDAKNFPMTLYQSPETADNNFIVKPIINKHLFEVL